MHPILIKIGGVSIGTYGFFVFLGIALAYIFLLNQTKHYNISKDTAGDIVFWAIIGGFASARLFYIAINWQDFIISPWQYLFSRSGFVFYPGLLGGALAVFIFIKHKKLSLLNTADFLAPAIPLAHSLGRVGCFFFEAHVEVAVAVGSPARCDAIYVFAFHTAVGHEVGGLGGWRARIGRRQECSEQEGEWECRASHNSSPITVMGTRREFSRHPAGNPAV